MWTRAAVIGVLALGVGCSRGKSKSDDGDDLPPDHRTVDGSDDEPGDDEPGGAEPGGSTGTDTGTGTDWAFTPARQALPETVPATATEAPIPVLPPYFPFLNANGIGLSGLGVLVARQNPAVFARSQEVLQATQERLRREDEIEAAIAAEYADDLAEYQAEVAAGGSPTYPVRRAWRQSEVLHVADADHLVSAAQAEFAVTMLEQTSDAVDLYVDMMEARSQLRALERLEAYLSSLAAAADLLVAAGEIGPARAAEVAGEHGAVAAELRETALRHDTLVSRLWAVLGEAPNQPAGLFADLVLTAPSGVAPDPAGLFDAALGVSPELVALEALRVAALTRASRQEWLMFEDPSPPAHDERQHEANAEREKAEELAYELDGETDKILAAVTGGTSAIANGAAAYAEAQAATAAAESGYADLLAAVAAGGSGVADLDGGVSDALEAARAVVEYRRDTELLALDFLRGELTLDRWLHGELFGALPLVWGVAP